MKNLLIALLVSLNLISCATPNCDSMCEKWNEAFHTHKQTILPLKSFVKVAIFAKIQDKILEAGSGSGFFISNTKIVTAKHVCDREMYKKGNTTSEHFPEISFESSEEIQEETVSISFTFGINTFSGEKYPVKVVKLSAENDLCILETEEEIKGIEVIKLSPVSPKIGEKVYNIAAPIGFSSTNMVPIFEGTYSGDMMCSLVDGRCSVYTIPIKPGSSGSAVLNEHGELIGVMFSGLVSFHEISFSCTYHQLKNFLKDEI